MVQNRWFSSSTWIYQIVPVGLITLGTVTQGWSREQVTTQEGKQSSSSPSVTKIEWLVQQSLKAGLTGDVAKRDVGLQQAIALDPNHRLARWQSGHVFVNGHWMDVAHAEQLSERDNTLTQYVRARSECNNTSDIARLARWCEREGLSDEAETHWQEVLNDSQASGKQREEAQRKLGVTWHDGRWWTAEEQAQADAWDNAVLLAERTWRAKMKGWRKMVQGRSADQRALAIRRLREMNDVAAIPLLESMYLGENESTALAAIEVLSAWQQAESTRALTRQAIASPWDTVREQAAVALEKRPLHDFVPLLLNQLIAPVQTQFRIRRAANGIIEHEHHVTRSGSDTDRVLQSRHVAAPYFVPTQRVVTQDAGVARQAIGDNTDQAVSEESVQILSAVVRAQQIEQQAAQENLQVQQHNQRFFDLLTRVSDVQLPDVPSAWWDWWRDYNDRTLVERKTDTRNVVDYHYYAVGVNNVSYEPPVQPSEVRESTNPWPLRAVWVGPSQRSGLQQPECFAPGTLVRTQRGLRPIDSIEPGDRVLSQDVETGELAYKCVRLVTVRQNAKMCNLSVDDETITTTMGHPFWVDNVGWRMARHLKTDDVLHALSGPRTLGAMVPTATTTAYNLVVDDFHSYFVGRASILVHDNIDRESSRTLTPGLPRESQLPVVTAVVP